MKNNHLKAVILTLALLLVVAFSGLRAQNNELANFKVLKSSGEIPLDFRQWVSEKYKIQKQQINKKDARWSRKAHHRFILESNFFLNEVLLSGDVLFNDPVTVYINKVAEVLLKDEPVLRNKLRFYAVKSPAVNAFATDQGLIFVNIGLIAQLENEAQLAFVLAHEITHYIKKHTLSLYLETEQINKGKGDYNRYSYDDRLFARHFRSREMENEADEVGMALYEKTAYSLKTVNGVFDVLLYAHLPFDELPFAMESIETKYYKIPEEYILKEIKSISVAEDVDDSESTHPNIKKRREKMITFIESRSDEGRSAFINPKEEFYFVRNLARFESLSQYMFARDYGNAFYNAFVLKKEFPDNPFVNRVFAASLYSLAKYHTQKKIGEVLTRHAKVEGQAQQIYHLFRQMKPNELAVVALYQCFKAHRQNPSDTYLKSVTEDLMADVQFKHKMNLSDFRRQPVMAGDTAEPLTDEPQGKYDRIRQSRKQSKDKEKIYDAFIELFQDPAFEPMFKSVASKSSGMDSDDDDTETASQRKARLKREDEIRKKGYSLGINKIVVVDPVYYIVDQTRKESLRMIDSEQAIQEYKENITNNARAMGLNARMLDTKNFKPGDINDFVYFSLLNDWLYERRRHDETTIIPYASIHVTELTEYFQTPYFVWSAAVSIKDRTTFTSGDCMACMSIYLIPIVIIRHLTPEFLTKYYFMLVDINTGEPIMIQRKEFNYKDWGDISNSTIYDILHQIKRKPRK